VLVGTVVVEVVVIGGVVLVVVEITGDAVVLVLVGTVVVVVVVTGAIVEVVVVVVFGDGDVVDPQMKFIIPASIGLSPFSVIIIGIYILW